MLKQPESFTKQYDSAVLELHSKCAIRIPIPNKIAAMPVEVKDLVILWDTGSSHCSIDQKLAEDLGLIHFDSTTVYGVDDKPIISYMYLIDLILLNENGEVALEFPSTVVYSLPAIRNSHLILGMNIINQGDFTVTHYNRNTVLSFTRPSQKIMILN